MLQCATVADVTFSPLFTSSKHSPYISTHANCQVVVSSASLTNYYGYLSSVSIYTMSRAGNGMMDHACWMLTQQSQFWFDLQLKILTPTHGPPNWSASPIGPGVLLQAHASSPNQFSVSPPPQGCLYASPTYSWIVAGQQRPRGDLKCTRGRWLIYLCAARVDSAQVQLPASKQPRFFLRRNGIG